MNNGNHNVAANDAQRRSVQPLTRARMSVSAKLRGLEIPSAFALATVASALNALDRNADPRTTRRLVDKATRLASTEVQP